MEIISSPCSQNSIPRRNDAFLRSPGVIATWEGNNAGARPPNPTNFTATDRSEETLLSARISGATAISSMVETISLIQNTHTHFLSYSVFLDSY